MTQRLNYLGKHRLQRYLAIVVFASIALPAVFSGGFLIWQNYQRTLEQESVVTAKSYVDLLQGGMSMPLWNVSPELGRPLVNSVLVDAAVLSIRVTTEKGQPFLIYDRAPREIPDSAKIVLTRDVKFNWETIGQVELTYSLAGAQSRATSETHLLSIILLTQLIVSMATISWVLHRRILSPLKQLSQAAQGIADGDLKTTIPQLGDDEFGDLSQQLELMRYELEANFTQLEQRVDKRTEELRAVNQTLQSTLDRLNHTQDYLVQSQKLAALGALVAGVAHELNTPVGNGLTVISSMCDACDHMKTNMANGLTRSALEQFIQDMDEGSKLVSRNLEKASELVSGFKQVAMDRTSVQRRKFSLSALLNEIRLTLSPSFKRTPYIVDVLVKEDVTMDSYPGPLGQVITNLLNNALTHAFEGREQGKVIIHFRQIGNEVELTVEDDGVGIAEEHQGKIFDPFFTTKLGAGGSGLGMHIAHNMVSSILGGKISLWSKKEKGTKFTLLLPLVAPVSAIVDENSDYDIYAAG